LNTRAAVDSLIKILVEQACSNQRGIVGGNIAEIGIRNIQRHPRMHLHAKRKKALP